MIFTGALPTAWKISHDKPWTVCVYRFATDQPLVPDIYSKAKHECAMCKRGVSCEKEMSKW